MNTTIGLERCLTFINCQMQPSDKPLRVSESGSGRRAVTISRQSGSGGHAVAQRLLEFLEPHTPGLGAPWTVFDRNLVAKVLEDHQLPKHLAQFMKEDRISEISDTMDELFGLHPPSWTLVRQTADTILHLAELGKVILIGRGANVITSRLGSVFHVRLVGSLEKRIERIQELENLSARKAREFVEKEDLGRKRYLKKYFGKDIEDPLLYHLVVNTDFVSPEETAVMIGEAVIGRTEGKSSKAKSALA